MNASGQKTTANRLPPSASPSPALAGSPHPVTGGWPLDSESEYADGDANGRRTAAAKAVSRRRQRTANVNGVMPSPHPVTGGWPSASGSDDAYVAVADDEKRTGVQQTCRFIYLSSASGGMRRACAA